MSKYDRERFEGRFIVIIRIVAQFECPSEGIDFRISVSKARIEIRHVHEVRPKGVLPGEKPIYKLLFELGMIVENGMLLPFSRKKTQRQCDGFS